MVCFQTKNPNLGKFLEGLAMEEDGISYRHLVYFRVFCYMSWTFGTVRGNLVFFPILVFCTKKNLATLYLMFSVTSLQCVQCVLLDQRCFSYYKGSIFEF
jgi:hypothetical protein